MKLPMKTLGLLCLTLIGAGSWLVRNVSAQEPVATTTRFVVLDIWVDSTTEALAAYQFELAAAGNALGQIRIVGIEGGEPAAFRLPPYYDSAAMQGDRVILAAFSLRPPDQLPRGRVRIASVHCQVTAANEAKLLAKPTTAATADGRSIPLRIEIQERTQP
jgi:hypothetical protein